MLKPPASTGFRPEIDQNLALRRFLLTLMDSIFGGRNQFAPGRELRFQGPGGSEEGLEVNDGIQDTIPFKEGIWMSSRAISGAILILGITIGGLFMAVRAQAQAEKVDRSISVAYYYKIKWGYQDEFLELFKKNHYPLLEAQVKAGRLLKVETYVPRFHGDGRSDWTFMTVLTFKDWQALGDSSVEAELIKKMYPNQAQYRKEEQRRFELLEAHWDVPLKPAPMK